jgi:phage tail sheath gpL-like
MGKSFVVNVSQGDTKPTWVSATPHSSVQNFINYLKALNGSGKPQSNTLDVRDSAVAASGTLTLSGATGTVGAIINGVSVTVTAAGGDTATAAAIAVAINASVNALVQNIVTASASGAVVTITAVVPGVTGNCITLAESGAGLTASGARLTGGTETVLSYSF